MKSFVAYCHHSRTYSPLGNDTQEPRPVQPPEVVPVTSLQEVGGLHHRYGRRAARGQQCFFLLWDRGVARAISRRADSPASARPLHAMEILAVPRLFTTRAQSPPGLDEVLDRSTNLNAEPHTVITIKLRSLSKLLRIKSFRDQ